MDLPLDESPIIYEFSEAKTHGTEDVSIYYLTID